MRAVATVGVTLGLLCGVTGPAAAAPCPPDTLYLALGDSLTAGYQPDTGDQLRGGYVGVVRRHLAEDTSVTFRNLACSGETSTTFRDGGRCDYSQGSQLAQAQQALQRHRGSVVITLTLGANDVQKCATASGIDLPCVQQGMAAVATNLPDIFTTLRAASPQAKVVALNYYNPILAYWATGAAGQAMATASVPLATQLNSVLAKAASSINATTANVAADFVSDDFTPGPSGVPVNVETICAWTWACSKKDIHPNDDGYRVLGAAAVDALENTARR